MTENSQFVVVRSRRASRYFAGLKTEAGQLHLLAGAWRSPVRAQAWLMGFVARQGVAA